MEPIDAIIICLPMLVCAFWSAQLIMHLHRAYSTQLKQEARPDLHGKQMLLVFMLAATLLYGGHVVFFARMESLLAWTDTIYVVCNLSVYPLYLLYIATLTDRCPSVHHLLGWRWTWLLLPAAAGGLAVGTLYALMSPAETQAFFAEYLYANRWTTLTGLAEAQAWAHNVCKACFALQVVLVFVVGQRLMRRHDRDVRNFYADTEGRTLDTFHLLLILFIATSAISTVANLIGRYWFADSMMRLSVPSAVFSVLLFLIGFYGLHQTFTAAEMQADATASTPADGGGPRTQPAAPVAPLPAPAASDEDQPDQRRTLSTRIMRVLTDEQLFLQPNLKIPELAKRLGTNRTYLYEAINIDMGTNFSELINRMRIDHAARLIETEPSLLLTEVALRSGFTSDVSFRRNFRAYKGCSPTEWRLRTQAAKASD